MSKQTYPWTYAGNFLREEVGPHISVANAAKIFDLVAEAFDTTAEDVAHKLACVADARADEAEYSRYGAAGIEKIRRSRDEDEIEDAGPSMRASSRRR